MALTNSANQFAKGLEALKIEWDEGPNATVDTDLIWNNLRAASQKDGAVAKSVGDATKLLATGDRFEALCVLKTLSQFIER